MGTPSNRLYICIVSFIPPKLVDRKVPGARWGVIFFKELPKSHTPKQTNLLCRSSEKATPCLRFFLVCFLDCSKGDILLYSSYRKWLQKIHLSFWPTSQFRAAREKSAPEECLISCNWDLRESLYCGESLVLGLVNGRKSLPKQSPWRAI